MKLVPTVWNPKRFINELLNGDNLKPRGIDYMRITPLNVAKSHMQVLNMESQYS